MVLVDTSVLIDYLRGQDNKSTLKFQHILSSNIPFGINSMIYQEILQGVKTEREFRELKKYLDTQRFYNLIDERDSFAKAAMIYFKCRKKGISINSIVDFIVVQTAIENNLFLLHNDRDFKKISEVVTVKFF